MVCQTVHVMGGSDRRYINLRHLLMKWLLLVGVLQVGDYFKQHTVQAELFSLAAHLLAFFLVYPSKVTPPPPRPSRASTSSTSPSASARRTTNSSRTPTPWK